ncbi:MAG: phosphate/phosphite/phosphonate ABC transporter substrate-binding protein [Planctomycetota bacterium]
MTPSVHPFRDRRAGSAIVTVLVCVALVAAAVAVYIAASSSSNSLGNQTQREQRLLGLNTGLTNQLDARYADADGDLIADPPETTRDPETLKLSYLSEAADIEPAALLSLGAAVSEATGREVEVVSFADESSALLALSKGQVDIAGFNTGNVPRAVNVAGFVPVAAPSTAGQPAQYRMVITVPAGSAIQTLADLEGRTIAFTRPGSNSGYKAPLVLLREQAGLTPPTNYRWTFSFGHAASITGLSSGQYEAIATASDLLDAAVEAGDIETGAFRIVYESEAFPVAAIGHAHDLDPALAEKITQALVAFTPTGATSEALVGADAMSAVNFKDDFALIRRIDDAAGFAHTLPGASEAEPQDAAEDQAPVAEPTEATAS